MGAALELGVTSPSSPTDTPQSHCGTWAPRLPSPSPKGCSTILEGSDLATKQLNISSWSSSVQIQCIPLIYAPRYLLLAWL